MERALESQIDKALSTQRETRSVEFKSHFDPTATGDWCELIKDIVAIANSGGGVIVVGLDSKGDPADFDISKLRELDPAEISNRFVRYVGSTELNFEISIVKKKNVELWALTIDGLQVPCIFEKPGSYQDPDQSGKQKTAFGMGTTYFRHGAKSEPGNNNDVARSIHRHLNETRKRWLGGLRKVVTAPQGSSILVSEPGKSKNILSIDPDIAAIPIRITKDNTKSEGVLLHEEISAELFGEINNVIESNKIIFPDRDRFLLGQAAYYRIYAERFRVEAAFVEIEKLLVCGIVEYHPMLYWAKQLPASVLVPYLADMYLHPKGLEVNQLLRVVALLGYDFRQWIAGRFKKRWGKYSQPPAWFHRCLTLAEQPKSSNPLLLSSGLGLQASVQVSGENLVMTAKLVQDPELCNRLLSKASLAVFNGDSSEKQNCRKLDVLCNGSEIVSNGDEISSLLQNAIGDKLPGEGKS